MPSRIFRIFGSYDFHGKSLPGIAFIIGIMSFLPAKWFFSLDSSNVPSHLVTLTIVLILVILAGTLLGEAVFALALYIEKMVAWIANRVKNILKIINNTKIFRYSRIDNEGRKRYELDDLEQDGESTLPDNEEQVARNRRERWKENWKYGILKWLNKRLTGIRLALIRHRVLFTSKIIRPLSHPHEGPKKTSISDLNGVQQYLVRTVEDEFAVIHRDEFTENLDQLEDDFLNDLTNVGENEFDDDHLLRRRDVKSVYPVVTTLLASNDITSPDKFQTRYTLCRSMWVVLLLLIISYMFLLLPTLSEPAWATITVTDPLITRHGEELIWQKIIPFLALFMIFFIVSAGKYKKYYVEYLISGYCLVKNDYGKIPSISMGEIEHKLNKASDKTEGTTHKSTEIKNNIGEKKQEIRELEKIREKLINENNVIKKYRSSDPCEAEIDNEGRLAGFLEYYLEGTREDPRTPDSLSEQRLHKLIYLTELLLIRKELHPPLRIDFRPFIDGIFSKEVHESLSELDTVNKRPVYVKGNNVTKCTTNSVKTNLEESDKEIARRIFRNCKHLNSSKITDTVRATPPFSGTKYGVEMGLRTLYE